MTVHGRCVAWRFTVVSLIAALALIAGASGGSAQPRSGGVVLATQADAARLDPAATGDVPSMMIQSVMFEGLVGWDKDQKLVPQIAESWTFSDGGKVITFKLRRGVKFHDGEEFDAQAAKVNFDRWLDKANALLTLSQFSSVDGVEVVDKYTLKMTLKEVNGAILQTLAGRRAMFNSPKALAKWGKDINLHPTGTGPFEFVEWVPKDHITVKRFDGYWGPKPSIEKITFKPVPEPASRVAMLEAGDADMAAPIPIQDVERLKANPKFQVMTVDSLDNLHFALNTQKDIFKDARVRQAVNYAVDKDSIVKNIYNGLAVPLTKSPVSPFLWGYSAVGDYYRYNPAKAKELLKEAGVKPGTKLVMWIPDGRYVQDRQVGEAVAGYLREVGFEVQIQKMEWATYTGRVAQKPDPVAPYDMAMLAWSVGTQDADWGLSGTFLSTNWPPRAFNLAFYKSDTVDNALAAGRQTTDPAKRMEAYKTAQRQIMEDAPWLFLVAYKFIGAAKKDLHNAYVIPFGGAVVKDASFAK
jgi:ABC-type transport system substrate-binding protein